MRSTYRNLQIIKHALQYYISRPNANEKDLAREKSLLERIEDEVEYYQKAYHIPKKEVEIMDIKEQMKSQIPLGEFGSVQDIANAVVFLASDEAKYITGQTLHVDGGMAM